MRSLYLFLAITISAHLFAQGPTIQWQKCFGGTALDGGRFIQSTMDGGYMVAGAAVSNNGDVIGNHGLGDWWLIKLDDLGDVEWKKCYGGSENEEAYLFEQTPDSGYIVAGFTISNDMDVSGNHGGMDIWVMRINSVGTTLWSKCYGGSLDEGPSSIHQTPDGGYIFSGYTKSSDGDAADTIYGQADIWVVKIDSIGTIQWEQNYGGPGNEINPVSGLTPTIDGGYIGGAVTDQSGGNISDSIQGENDIWIFKIDAIGNIEWQELFGGTGNDYVMSIIQAADDGYVFSGHSTSVDGDLTVNHGVQDVWVVKLNSSGQIVWQHSYGGSNIDRSFGIIETADGGYLSVGESKSSDGDVSSNQGMYDILVIKLDALGILSWEGTYGGSGTERSLNIIENLDGSIVFEAISGSQDGDISGNHGTYDAWVVKLNAYNMGTEPNFAKAQLTIYPNPTSENITITGFTDVLLVRIMDLNGKQLLTQSVSIENPSIDLSTFPKGAYFVEVMDNKNSQRYKIIKN